MIRPGHRVSFFNQESRSTSRDAPNTSRNQISREWIIWETNGYSCTVCIMYISKTIRFVQHPISSLFANAINSTCAAATQQTTCHMHSKIERQLNLRTLKSLKKSIGQRSVIMSSQKLLPSSLFSLSPLGRQPQLPANPARQPPEGRSNGRSKNSTLVMRSHNLESYW